MADGMNGIEIYATWSTDAAFHWVGTTEDDNDKSRQGRYLQPLVVPLGMGVCCVQSPTLFAVFINDIVSQLPFSR